MMTSEREEARLGSMALFEMAKSHNYEGEWAQVAIAGANLEIAAAVWELKDFLDWALERSSLVRPPDDDDHDSDVKGIDHE